MAMTSKARCPWCGDDPAYQRYHDEEWGVPVHDDRTWFEFLLLEGAQAGLSWLTILRKREAYRRAFADFDPEQIVHFGPADVDRLMHDDGIVRHRLKIESVISNARAFLDLKSRFGSFDAWIWGQVGGEATTNRYEHMDEVPASTERSETISRALKSQGFRFVGPTIVYALMQATGLVNDHLVSCFRWSELRQGEP
jgi:DNA-3-methyladenine glycosylase I